MSDPKFPGHEQSLPPAEVPSNPGLESAYSVSVRQLFAALDEPHADDPSAYFKVEWERTSQGNASDVLKSVEPLHIEPTGARRQRLPRGKYGQFQYRLSPFERPEPQDPGAEDDDEFIWLSVAEGSPDEEAVVLTDEATGQSYYKLDGDQIADILVERADTTDALMELVAEMEARGVDGGPIFQAEAARMAYRLFSEQLTAGVANGFESYDRALDLMRRARMKETTLRALQGRIVSKLLGAVSVTAERSGLRSPQEAAQLRAAASDLMVRSFLNGALPVEARITDRVFTHMGAYDRPEMIPILHGHMTERYVSPTAQIFGLKRETFAHDFMLVSLRMLMHASKADSKTQRSLGEFIASSQELVRSGRAVNFKALQKLAKDLGYEEQDTGTEPPAGETRDYNRATNKRRGTIVSSYGYVLYKIKDSLPADAPIDTDMCLDIAAMTLPQLRPRYHWIESDPVSE